MEAERGNSWNTQRAVIALMVAATLLLSAGIALGNMAPRASDFYIHLQFASEYTHGQLAMLDSALMKHNNGPYPPLFHLILAVPAFFGHAIGFGVILEIVFYPLAILATAFLTWKLAGKWEAVFTAALLLGAVEFFGRGAQVIPQALEMLLMPLVVLAFCEAREKLFVAGNAVMAYAHAPYSFLLFAPFAVLAVWKGKNKAMVAKAALVMAPIALLLLLYLPNLLSAAGTTNNPQEQQIIATPVVLLQFIGVPLVIAFVFALAWKFVGKKNTGGEDGHSDLVWKMGLPLENFSLLWLACLLPMLAVFPDRFASYSAQPMAILAGSVFGGRLKGKTRLVVLGIILLLSLYFIWQWYALFLEGRIRPMP